MVGYMGNCRSLRIQICPKEGITPTFLLWGWDWEHQSYEKSGGVWMLIGDMFQRNVVVEVCNSTCPYS